MKQKAKSENHLSEMQTIWPNNVNFCDSKISQLHKRHVIHSLRFFDVTIPDWSLLVASSDFTAVGYAATNAMPYYLLLVSCVEERILRPIQSPQQWKKGKIRG